MPPRIPNSIQSQRRELPLSSSSGGVGGLLLFIISKAPNAEL